MKKILKKWGGSIIIRFSPEEVKIFNLKKDDVLELDDNEFKKHAKKLKKELGNGKGKE